jgi:hypothetical protein
MQYYNEQFFFTYAASSMLINGKGKQYEKKFFHTIPHIFYFLRGNGST